MPRRWYENRAFRLLVTLLLANGVIVFVQLVLSVGLAALLFLGTVPPGHWTFLLAGAVHSGVFAGQLLMLCLVGALVEKARWSMWLAVMPFALLLSVAFLAFQMGPGVYFFARMRDLGGALEMIVLLAAVVPLTICYGGVLLLSILLWPLKVFSGWRAAWLDEPGDPVGKAPISHLMIWVGLWGALFLLATTLSEGFGSVAAIAGSLGLVLILVTGLPVALLLSSGRGTLWQCTAAASFILLLSFVESELVYWIAQPPGLTSLTRVLPIVLAFNASLAGTIALNCHLMRRRGLRLHMPLPWWRRTSPTTAGAISLTPDS
ncbi:MAG TPA: hypothetical protein VMP01_01505 [Pirellulaceae bacterium]|nr:hypothetical protein [Pirellulaceae bacterium]